MKLHVTLVSEASLAGEPWEYAPYVATYANWGRHRITAHSGRLAADTPVTMTLALPAAPMLQGDERVWFKLEAYSRNSGIASINAQDKGRREYQVQCGMQNVPLHALLDALAERDTTPLEVACNDATLFRALEASMAKAKGLSMEQLEVVAGQRSYKGTLAVRVLPAAGTTQKQIQETRRALQLAMSRAEREGRLLYESPRMIQSLQFMQKLLLTEYSEHFFGRFTDEGERIGDPTYALGSEKSLEHMHLPLMPSEWGDMHPIALSQHHVESRLGLAPRLTPEERGYYGPSKAGGLVLEKQVQSLCSQLGYKASVLIEAVRLQLGQSPTDASIRADFLRAVLLGIKFGTNRGNALNYMKDYRIENRQTMDTGHMDLMATPQRANVSLTVRTSVRLQGRLFGGAARSMLYGRQQQQRVGGGEDREEEEEEEEEQETTVETETESMDAVGIHGGLLNDDCEGSAQTAVNLLRVMPIMATQVTPQEAPLLHAMVKCLSYYYHFEAVASVTSAYLDTSGKPLSREQQRAMTDLPLIGSEEDRRRQSGGHCHGMSMSKVVVAEALKRGGQGVPPALADYVARQATAWERRLPTHIIEGTASSESLVLPAEEVAQHVIGNNAERAAFVAEAEARHTFLKGLQLEQYQQQQSAAATAKTGVLRGSLLDPTLDSDAEEGSAAAAPPLTPLLQHAHPEGQAYYVKRQDPNRRVSSFYLGNSHLVSLELSKLDMRYAQLSWVNPLEKTRGAEIGAIMRLPYTANPAVALVPTFSNITSKQWQQHVVPVMACIQNQMPLASVDFFPTDESFQQATLRSGCVLPPYMAAQGFCADPQFTLAQGLERFQRAAAKMGAATTMTAPEALSTKKTAAAVPSSTRLTFSVPAHNVKEPGAMAAVLEDLDHRKQEGTVLDYVLVADRPLLQGNDIVTIAVTLPVKSSSTVS